MTIKRVNLFPIKDKMYDLLARVKKSVSSKVSQDVKILFTEKLKFGLTKENIMDFCEQEFFITRNNRI